MAIPTIGGGRQVGDGNLNEFQMGAASAPQTATVTATLTAAQILGGILTTDPSTSAGSYTLPLATDLDTSTGNAKIGSTFDFVVINLGTSSGTATILTNTGWTLVGKMSLPITTTVGSSAMFRARKTAAGAWTLYRTAG